jgi:hypothetical protein
MSLSLSELQSLNNIKWMTGICLLPIWVIYSWQTCFRAESSACWKAAYTEYEQAGMSAVQEWTSRYLTTLHILTTSITDGNTADRRSSNILSTDYQTVVYGSMGLSGRFSGLPLVLGFCSTKQNLSPEENSCLTSQEISRLLWDLKCYLDH